MNEPADGTKDTDWPAPGCLYGVGVGPGDRDLLQYPSGPQGQQLRVARSHADAVQATGTASL